MSGPVVVGLSTRMAIKTYRRYPELVEQTIRDARLNLTQRAAQRDRVLTGNEVTTIHFVRFVREQHHEHGWQLIEQGCTIENAEFAVIIIESATNPKETADA